MKTPYNSKIDKIMLITILIVAILIQTDQTLATTPTLSLYTPSVTSYQITNIKTQTDYSLSRDSNAGYYKYNGTNWYAITSPSTIGTGALTIIEMEKINNTQFLVFYRNNTAYQTFLYDPTTSFDGTWTDLGYNTLSSGQSWQDTSLNKFSCNPRGTSVASCITITKNTTSHIRILNASNLNVLSTPSGIGLPTTTGLPANVFYGSQNIFYTDATSLQRYNPFTWANVLTVINGARDLYQNELPVIFGEVPRNIITPYITGQGYIYRYNQSNGLYFGQGLDIYDHSLMVNPDTDKIYVFPHTMTQYYEYDYYFDDTKTTINTTMSSCTINFDAIDSDDKPTADYTYGWIGCTDGRILKFSEGNIPNQETTTETPQEKAYDLTTYTYTLTNLSNINSIATLGLTQTLAVATLNGKTSLVLFDHINPNNVIITSYTLTGRNNNPLSIATNGDQTIIGTGSNADIFNNTRIGDATEFVLQNTNVKDGLVSDVIYALETIGTEIAVGCDASTLNPYFIKYNLTLGDDVTSFADSLGICRDIAVKGDRAYIHYGNNGLRIQNVTTMASGTYFDTVDTQPSGITNDRLSTYGTNLAIVTGRNTIKVYSTNTTTPTLMWECRTSSDITSLEMLDDQKIVIGVGNRLQICDTNNTALYDNTNNYYISKQLYSNPSATPIIDLKHNDGLTFTGATGDKLILFNLLEGELANINLPPIINSVSIRDTTPCINQTLYIQVEASDIDTPLELGIYYKCNPDDNYQFTSTGAFICNYDTSGSKTIRIKAEDSVSETTTTRNVNVDAGCVANVNSFIANLLVRDAYTTNALEGALINVIGYTNVLTDASGYATIELPTQTTYNITISKTGYLTKTTTMVTGNYIQIAELQPTTITDPNGTITSRTMLTVIVKDRAGQPITEAIVSATDLITGISKSSSTDVLGKAYLLDLPTGVSIRISAGKSNYADCTQVYNSVSNNYEYDCSNAEPNTISQEYKTSYLTTTLTTNEQKTIIITLLKIEEETQVINSRGCQDYVEGLILCSPLNISGGDGCKQDADCIGGRCALHGLCSNYNYTACDNAGTERGAWCFASELTKSGGNWLSDTLLDYFLYFLVFAIFMVIIFIMIYGLNKR